MEVGWRPGKILMVQIVMGRLKAYLPGIIMDGQL